MSDTARIIAREPIAEEPLAYDIWTMVEAPKLEFPEPLEFVPLDQWQVRDVAEPLAADDYAVVSLEGPHNERRDVNLPRGGAEWVHVDDVFLGPAGKPTKRNLFDRLVRKSRIEFAPTVERTWKTKIPVIRIHCPRAEGCLSRYEWKKKTKRAQEFKVRLPGIGGGASQDLTLTDVEAVVAIGGCVEQVHETQLKIQWGTTYKDGQPFSYGYRIGITEVDDGAFTRDIDPEFDDCGLTVKKLTSLQKRAGRSDFRPFYDLTGLSKDRGMVEHTIDWGRESSFFAELGPKLDFLGVPVELGLKISQTTEEHLQLSHKLAPGGRYYPYHPTGEPFTELCWTMKT